jgi:uncharacterized protein with PIN domain
VNDQLQNLGFLIAHDKYHCSPCQKLDWLGYTWDTVNGLIIVKEEIIQNLEKCEKGKKMFRVRFFASIVGHIIYMHAVFGDTVRQNIRFLHDCVLSRISRQVRLR